MTTSLTRRLLGGVLVVLLVSGVAGCVSTHMKQFIGKDAVYIQIEDGPPVDVFDLPDGRRAFQYFWGGGTYQIPKTATTQGQVTMIGSTAWYSEQKIESGGQVIESNGCRITYLTKWDTVRKGWIVMEIAYPKRLSC